MESPASSPSSSRGRNTRTAPLMGGGTEDCGVPQPTTMTRRKSGASVRVSLQLNTNGPVLTICSAWRKCLWGVSKSTFAILTVEKWSLCQARGLKRMDLSPLIKHGRVLGVTHGKPIRVSSPIPFKSQELCYFGGWNYN